MEPERYRIGDLRVDLSTFSVTREGVELALPGLSFDLLVALARRAPAVVSTDELAAMVWNGTAISDETLTQRVALLRRALGDDAREPRYVRSVRGRGYALVPAVTPAVGNGRVPAEGARRRRVVVAVGALLLASLGTWWAVRSMPEPRQGAAGRVRTSPTGADDLVARADVYLARHREEDNELAIDLYRQALEVESHHVGALAGWSFGLSQRVTKFNRPGEERFEALELADRALVEAPGSALAHHARALALDSLGRHNEALAEYRRAADIDPSRIWATSSAAYVLFVQGRLAEALETNVRVAGGDLLTPYVEVQLGTTLAALGYREAADVWLERAVRLRPDNVFAALAFARVRLSEGRFREAEAIARTAIERGIRRPGLHVVLANVALVEGRFASAAEALRRAIEVNPRLSDAPGRRLVIERRVEGDSSDLDARYRELAGALRASRDEGDESPEDAYLEFAVHAGFGNDAAALEALDAAIALGFRDAGWLVRDPLAGELRQNPRLLSRVDRIRALIEQERRRVEAAEWLPPDLLTP